ncbi:hypothetical protein AUF14_17255 [Enterococcus avium]|nr:hypothetical protein AUF14_17255 [Enterococcus avium]
MISPKIKIGKIGKQMRLENQTNFSSEKLFFNMKKDVSSTFRSLYGGETNKRVMTLNKRTTSGMIYGLKIKLILPRKN